MRLRFLPLIFAIVAVAGLALSRTASAQYPDPVGSITATTSATSAAPGGSANISCTVRDEAGAPIEGASVAFAITTNPGGAALTASEAVTAADGTTTVQLDLGTAPGVVSVECSSGELTSVVLVEVLGASGLPPAGPIEPPGTGDGGLLGSKTSLPRGLSLLILLWGAIFLGRVLASSFGRTR